MSDAIKVVKKRGRPKKTVESDTIVIIDSSSITELQKEAIRTKKSKVTRSSILSSEIDLVSRKRGKRKPVTKDDAEVETPKVIRARRSAKSTENVTSSVEEAIDTLTAASETPRPSILNQAKAFQELKIENLVADTVEQVPQKQVEDVEAVASKESTLQETVRTTSTNYQKFGNIESRLSALRNDIRLSSIERIEISLDRSANHPSQLANSILIVKSEITQRLFAESLQKLDQSLASLAETISHSSSELQSLIQYRRSRQIQRIAEHIKDLTNGTLHSYKVLREAEAATLNATAALLARKTQTYGQLVESQVESLINNIQESRSALGDFASRQRSLNQTPSAVPFSVNNENRIQAIQSQVESLVTRIEESTTEIRNITSSRTTRYPTPRITSPTLTGEDRLQNVQSQTDSLTNEIQQSKIAIQNFTPQTSKPEISSANPIQSVFQGPQERPSTQPTMSPLQRSRPTTHHNQSRPPAPSRSHPRLANPQPQPQPLSPTQQPYDTLRKSPDFKRESRRWTARIVGIPVLIVTSWILYKRYEGTIQSRLATVVTREEIDGRRRGELPSAGGGNGPGKGIGVDRSSDVGVNGGV